MMEFHADDFGLFERQSQRILNCYKNGVLNGVSIMPNSECLSQCIHMLRPYINDIELSVHLNLVEGRCLSDIKDVPLLVNEEGIFNVSFMKLLVVSFLPIRKKYVNQIHKELKKQIQIVYNLIGQKSLRLDSHVHYHMLPVVFDALMEVLEQEKFPVDYIRIPNECIFDYISSGAVSELKPINLIKAIILKILSWRNQYKYRSVLSAMEQKKFYGVVHSGNMKYEIVRRIIKKCKKHIENGESVEILFHPGSVLELDDQKKLTSKDDMIFLTHPGRKIEADSLIRLKEDKLV